MREEIAFAIIAPVTCPTNVRQAVPGLVVHSVYRQIRFLSFRLCQLCDVDMAVVAFLGVRDIHSSNSFLLIAISMFRFLAEIFSCEYFDLMRPLHLHGRDTPQ